MLQDVSMQKDTTISTVPMRQVEVRIVVSKLMVWCGMEITFLFGLRMGEDVEKTSSRTTAGNDSVTF